SKLVNNIFKDLKLISSSDLLINFVNEKLRSSDTQFIIEKFPDISQPSIDTNSIIFYTSEPSDIDQKINIILNKIEKDIKLQTLELISVYKNIAAMKLEINHKDSIQTKKNELDFYNSDVYKESNAKKDELFNRERNLFLESEKANDFSLKLYPFKLYPTDRKAELEFELDLLLKSNPEKFRLIEILDQVEINLKDITFIKPGKLVDIVNRKPTANFLMFTFSIIGLFFGFIFILLTSGFSKNLMIRMSSFLQGPK
ncbi:hypothetical protein OAP58_03465, partial [Candidatus Pelagibacter sp.]|nr:hypothetical protein [Candidatus Pelagibacter sp.]